MAFLNIEDKQDSASQQEANAGLPSHFKYTADEWNLMRDKINDLRELIPDDLVPTSFLDIIEVSTNITLSDIYNKKQLNVFENITDLNNPIPVSITIPVDQNSGPSSVTDHLQLEIFQLRTTAPTLVISQGVTLLYDSNIQPSFDGVNTGLRLTYFGDDKWHVSKITSKGSSSLLPIIDLSSITTPQTGQVILDSEDLNALKYFNGTDFVGIESAFKLAVQQTGAVDETKNVARSGKTSFGGDEPLHQVEVIGDFYNKEIFANGSESIIEVAESLFGDFGIPENVIKGITALLKKQGTNAYGGYAITETEFGVVEDLAAIFGLQRGNPIAPTDFARIKAFRRKDGEQEFITDIETKNGGRLNRLRVRDGYLETQKPIRLNGYSGSNGLEGYQFEDTTNGTQTIGAPTHALAIGANNYLMKTDLPNRAYLMTADLFLDDGYGTFTDAPNVSFNCKAGISYKIDVVGAFENVDASNGMAYGFRLSSGTGTINGTARTTSDINESTLLQGKPITVIGSDNSNDRSLVQRVAFTQSGEIYPFGGDFIFNCLTDGVFKMTLASESTVNGGTFKAGTGIIVNKLN